MNDSVKNIMDKVKERAINAGEVAGKSLDKAGKRANEIWGITRLNMQINDLYVAIEKKKLKIGEIIYNSHINKNADESRLDELLTEIDMMNQNIEQYKAKILDVKQIVICEKCGKGLGKTDIFCRFCGTENASAAATQSQPTQEITISIVKDMQQDTQQDVQQDDFQTENSQDDNIIE